MLAKSMTNKMDPESGIALTFFPIRSAFARHSSRRDIKLQLMTSKLIPSLM